MVTNVYPVIDLFAGPGGLGEGFASLPASDKKQAFFQTRLSIEKDPDAHKTLQLRHFFRAFAPGSVPTEYYEYLKDCITVNELYSRYPEEFALATESAWLCTLGTDPNEIVASRIANALKGHKKWALVGGPPCQAYSIAGRSRMMGDPDFATDPRHFLYKQYLQILAAHQPPVFVMENVKGLLSAEIQGESTVRNILRDLHDPLKSISGQGGSGYRLYSFSESGLKNMETDPAAFTVKAEEYGIPQARHRLFILGIREDVNVTPPVLEKNVASVSVQDVIGNMPALRSGLSRGENTSDTWKQALSTLERLEWFIEAKGDTAAVLARTKDVMQHICASELQQSSKNYVAPNTLEEWFSDDQLNVLVSHEARPHMTSDLHRYLFAASFAEVNMRSPKLSDFPSQLLPEHKNAKQGADGQMFSDRFRVQLRYKPSTTITSHISKDGHYFIHYDPHQCRSLTVREAARLQTFPDNYKFEGTRTSQYHQVGNAVPPLLANKIAKIVHGVLEKMD